MKNKYMALVSTILLVAIFLFAGIDKLFHYQGFIKALSSYVLVPDSRAPYLALPIILSEIWIGAGLLVKAWRNMASLIAACFLLLFTIALTVNYIKSPKSICGCWFSITLGTATITHIFLNLTLFGLAIFLWMDASSTNKSPEPDSAQFSPNPNSGSGYEIAHTLNPSELLRERRK